MTKPPSHSPSWSSLLLTSSCALATIIASDVALSLISPIPPAIMEVDDGIEMLRTSDPETLFLGSSHTRSFVPLRESLQNHEIALVPVEWGIFSSYQWVLNHRIAPLLDAKPSVRRVVLITTFYDMCDVQDIGNINLPTKAWELEHFTADIADRGLTTFNRNYLQTRWKAAFPYSVLIQNRGHERVADALREQIRPIDESHKLKLWSKHVTWATQHIEQQYETCWPDAERQALNDILDAFDARGIEVTLVLFPLMPDIISATSRETTLARYSSYITDLGRRRHLRVIDMTFSAPLEASDFQDDFDHLTHEANLNFAAWALDTHMSFLQTPVHDNDGAAP